MHPHVVQSGGFAPYLYPLVSIVVVFAIRARSMGRERPLRLEWLWVVPAIYLALCIASAVAAPPTPLGWAAMAAGVAIGGAIGWWRGTTFRIAIDPGTHRLNQRASPWAMLLLMAIVMGRVLLQTAGRQAHWEALGNGLLGLGLGTFSATRAEMFLRGRRLLAAASPVA